MKRDRDSEIIPSIASVEQAVVVLVVSTREEDHKSPLDEGFSTHVC
jgi:hypothetical protein